VKAWAIGPGGTKINFLALKARNAAGGRFIHWRFYRYFTFRAFSAFTINNPHPGALPQAITFRAFGAKKPEFYTFGCD
jgi:hypothetical protein